MANQTVVHAPEGYRPVLGLLTKKKLNNYNIVQRKTNKLEKIKITEYFRIIITISEF